MEKLILFCIILMIIEQALAIAYNFSTRARNEEINKNHIDLANKKIKYLEDSIEFKDADLRRMTGKKISSTGFILTAEGIRLLPYNWEKSFDTAWNITKPNPSA